MRWTERKKQFCWHMARTANATKSAELAGFGATSSQEDKLNALRVAATRLMKCPYIRAEIQRQRKYYLTSIGADKDRLMAETLARAGITHDGQVYTAHDFIKRETVEHVRRKRDGSEVTYQLTRTTLVPKEELPKAAQRMVAAIKVSYSPGGEENVEVKFWDQLKAIELAAKLAHLLKDNDEDPLKDVEAKTKLIRDALKQMDELDGPASPYVDPDGPAPTAH